MQLISIIGQYGANLNFHLNDYRSTMSNFEVYEYFPSIHLLFEIEFFLMKLLI